MPFSPRLLSKEWTIDVPASLVWDVLVHTEKLNRAVGLPPMQPGPLEGDGIGRPVDAWLYGIIPLSWIEYPFEWVRERRYVVQRDFTRGPLARFRGGIEVEPQGNGSRVRVFAEMTPRNLFGAVAIPLVGGVTLARTWDYCGRVFAEALADRTRGGSAPVPAGSSRRSPADETLLAQRAARLREMPSLDQRIVGRLLRHLAEADDEDVARMQPYALAARWGTPRHDALRVFLYATKAGLLTLMWELLCPNCRVPKLEPDTFALVPPAFHCDTCGISYEANLDRSVELRFRVHPAIRDARDAVYCFCGPYTAPHILVQHLLAPGETRELSCTLDDEPYRIRVLRMNHAAKLLPAPRMGAKRPVFVYRDGRWSLPEVRFVPGPVTWRWENGSSKPVAVVLERLRWDEHAAMASEITTMQEFRDLFGSEVLAPEQNIGVESVTILFSDLLASTRLYEETGDAPAYGHVRRHFEFLKERIARCRGAVVKTIGDAVMAAFFQPADAVRCGLLIQRDLPAFNRQWPDRRPLALRLGAHHGPAIAIAANGRLDYFGRTVNLAARLLRESQGGDVVLAKSLTEDPRVRETLEQEKASVVQEWTPALRGIREPLTLRRIAPS
jgi:class 3 adenylate cyclase